MTQLGLCQSQVVTQCQTVVKVHVLQCLDIEFFFVGGVNGHGSSLHLITQIENHWRALLIALYCTTLPETPLQPNLPPLTSFPHKQRTWRDCGISQGRLQEAISASESTFPFSSVLHITVFPRQL